MIKPSKNSALLALVVATLGGCGGSGKTSTRVIPPASRPVMKDASLPELLEKYNAYARSVKSVDATVELKTSTGSQYNGVIDEYHEVKAFLLAAQPGRIRVVGQVPVIGKTIFDMASDGERFEVSIPSKNRFLEGPVALERSSTKPLENLRPQHLFDAVLWPELRKEESVLIEEANDDVARYYVLTVLRGGYQTEILHRIWFDRSDLNMSRFESYGPKGALLSDVRYSDWQPVSTDANSSGSAVALQYPRKIYLDRAHDEYRLELSVGKVTLNETLEADRFKLAAPAGSELTHVGDASGGQKP